VKSCSSRRLSKWVAQVSRLQDGTRKFAGIAEVLGVKDDRIELQDIFVFGRTGLTGAGEVQGRFRSTDVKPKILERLRVAGIQLSPSVFDEVLEVNL
jgi:pilus assembly protein CpaF